MLAQQFAAERESARKELEANLAEALRRIAGMERAQRTMEEEMRGAKMAARQSLPAAVDDGQITLLKDKIVRLENELQHIKSTSTAVPLPTANKRVSLDSMSADELKSNYETLSIRNDLVQEELQRAQGMCDRLQDELVRLRSEAAADRDACSVLQLSLSNEKAASDALEQSLHALQSELSSVYSKLHAQECSNSSLQRLEQDMKALQRQASAAADQLRVKEAALLDAQRKLADENTRYLQLLCGTCGVSLITGRAMQVRGVAGCVRRRGERQRKAPSCTVQASRSQQSAGQRSQDDVRRARARLRRIADVECRYRKHKKDTADLEDKYKRDDYGRRYACASLLACLLCVSCATHCCCSYAISRLDRCEGLLQEWGTYVQSAAVTARAMDEVRRTASQLQLQTRSLRCVRLPPSTRRAKL